MLRISQKHWGMSGEKPVYLFELDNGCGLRACISNYGGVLQSLMVQNRRGEWLDVVLGYDTLTQYMQSDTFFGAMVGPIADRLAEGKCCVGGKTAQFPLNAGPDSMHCSDYGFHCRVWDWEALADGIALSGSFAPGELGLPGGLQVRLCYRLLNNALRLEYEAVSNCETALSLTNHSYFTLNGGVGSCSDHVLRLFADTYAETRRERDPICTGRTLSVENTPFDLRQGCRLEAVIACHEFDEIRTGGGIDHFFPVRGQGMRNHALLHCAESGLGMLCRSTAPGLLVYSANGLRSEMGKRGAVYEKNWAVCMETECFPNAVNFPEHRADVLLQPGERYASATEFCFMWDDKHDSSELLV